MNDWIELLHNPEFYHIAFRMFGTVPYDDDRWAFRFPGVSALDVISPLGIRSRYPRLLRVQKSVADLGILEYLSEDTKKFLPTYLFPRGAKYIQAQDGSEYYGFGSLVFIWAEPDYDTDLYLRGAGNDINFPAIVEVKHLGINFDSHGVVNVPKKTRGAQKPTLKASYVFASWVDEEHRYTRANGPSIIGFRNYREFWSGGKFKRSTWDKHAFDWPYMFMKDGTTEEEVAIFLRRAKKHAPRSNQFFKDERDEFNYLTEFMCHA